MKMNKAEELYIMTKHYSAAHSKNSPRLIVFNQLQLVKYFVRKECDYFFYRFLFSRLSSLLLIAFRLNLTWFSYPLQSVMLCWVFNERDCSCMNFSFDLLALECLYFL
ncbi:unnamed protein product [Blepharisma stoltei]|uniref:Uncharacterized protein n=1 Tax=Blepharisma stoltei TaxID=1481888 RepID=A0AAU9K064_9CILI|nr:unnamed protein product [Blepharisma stoltei]